MKTVTHTMRSIKKTMITSKRADQMVQLAMIMPTTM